MKIPSGMSEGAVLAVIDKIADRLAPKFVFGYFGLDDIKQEAFIEGCKGLEGYDGIRPLENFLYIHIRNRLINFKRKHYERILDRPCVNCPLKAFDISLPSECRAYTNKEDCEPYRGWLSINGPKKNLMSCLDIENIDDSTEKRMSAKYDMDSQIEHQRLLDAIDDKIPIHLRQSYIKLRAGQKIPRRDKEEIKLVVAQVMELEDTCH